MPFIFIEIVNHRVSFFNDQLMAVIYLRWIEFGAATNQNNDDDDDVLHQTFCRTPFYNSSKKQTMDVLEPQCGIHGTRPMNCKRGLHLLQTTEKWLRELICRISQNILSDVYHAMLDEWMAYGHKETQNGGRVVRKRSVS